jgi:hypothetical protein
MKRTSLECGSFTWMFLSLAVISLRFIVEKIVIYNFSQRVAKVYLTNRPFEMRERNSLRVRGSSRKEPHIAEVTVLEDTFSTPRITIHK